MIYLIWGQYPKYKKNSYNSATKTKKKSNLKWAEDLNRHFFQRRHIDDQQTHEKMLNITNHQGNTNQNHNEILPHTCQNGYHQKRTQITNVGEGVEKGNLING